MNNSYFFEKNGWKGLAFEPQKSLNRMWSDRTTQCLEYALGDEEKEVEFSDVINDDTLSGISTEIDKKINSDIVQKYIVKQRCLKNILSERDIQEIDFMSIDVEGYELSVLKGIDFDKVNIKCIVIENNKHSKIKLRHYIAKRGYVLLVRLTTDDIFVKIDFLDKLYSDIGKGLN